MKRKAYSREERQEMILDQFYRMVGDGQEPYMTAYQMAKALGLNSAQNVRNIMEDMVKDNRLTFWQVNHRPGVDKKVYCPFPLVPFEDPPQFRKRTIRINGKDASL